MMDVKGSFNERKREKGRRRVEKMERRVKSCEVLRMLQREFYG